jgi:tetratricopeptide (TPR) repeat protein
MFDSRFKPLRLLHIYCLAVALVCSIATSSRTFAESVSDQDHSKIEALIEQLGSTNYATRIEAESQLLRFGVTALDQLRIARGHSNQQIAKIADYILASSNVAWSYDDDSPRVKKLLRHYGVDDFIGRLNALDQLKILGNDEGVVAIARIARFEPNGDLSKKAALALMELEDDYQSLDALEKRWRSILDVVEAGNNTACEWLKHCGKYYLAALSKQTEPHPFDIATLTSGLKLLRPLIGVDYEMPPMGLMKFGSYIVDFSTVTFDTAYWQTQVDHELGLINRTTQDSSLEVVQSLCREVVKMLLCRGKRDEAGQFAKQLKSLPVNAADLNAILNSAMWAIDHGLPELAIEIMEDPKLKLSDDDPAKAFQASLLETRMGLYQLAEAYRWLGNEAKVTETLKEIESLDEPYGDSYRVHDAIVLLQNRCMFDWAGLEFERFFNSLQAQDQKAFWALQWMTALVEGREYKRACELIEPYVEILRGLGYFDKWEAVESNIFFHRGMAQLADGKLPEAKDFFRKAFALYPENVDVVIEMYKLDGDEAYKQEVEDLIDTALKLIQANIEAEEARMREATPEDVATARREYANELNTLAWLTCNVNRNLDEALRLSVLSNRITPNSSAQTDTLSRCYFVNGDLKRAIYWQERAVSLEPSQRQLLYTLLEYRQKAKETSTN